MGEKGGIGIANFRDIVIDGEDEEEYRLDVIPRDIEKRRRRNFVITIFVTIIVTAAATSIILLRLYIGGNTDLSVRIEDISVNLQGVSKEINDVQRELDERIKTVERLKEEADVALNISSLNKEQSDAIDTLVKKELHTSDLNNLLWSLVFFLAGSVVTILVSRFFSK